MKSGGSYADFFTAALAAAAAVVTPQSIAAAANADAPLNSIQDIGPKLSTCWHPPHPNDQVTIRLSFTRDGALIGRPRISFMKSAGKSGPDTNVELANSAFAAVYECSPLTFTPALGSVVAGRVLYIRFIAAPPPTRSA